MPKNFKMNKIECEYQRRRTRDLTLSYYNFNDVNNSNTIQKALSEDILNHQEYLIDEDLKSICNDDKGLSGFVTPQGSDSD